MRYLFLALLFVTQFQSLIAQSEALLLVQNEYEAFFADAKDAATDNPWGILTDEKMEKEQSFFQGLSERLKTIETASFDIDKKINFDLLTLLISDRLFHLEFGSHQFPLNAEGGFLAGVVYSIQGKKVSSEEDYEKYLAQLAALPAYFAHREAQMKAGQLNGKSSPKLVVNNCLKLINHLLEKDPETTFFINPVKEHPQRKAAILQQINATVFPAYKKFKTFLEKEYLVNAPAQVGIAGITDGKAFYEQRVRFFTTLDISPAEVFAVGQAEVKRIRAEMEAIITELEFEGSFADFFNFLRTDEQFYCKTGEDLLEKASWITKRMEGQLPNYFGKLPRMPLTVKPVPAALAPNYTSGRYSPGSYEDNKAGEYWVNTSKLNSRPLYVLPALSLHEGVPGHHLQIMLAAELENVADFRRSTYLSAYGEGWALYTEFLGKEAGIYRTAYEDFGRLTYEMWRACRLVVDPGMHYMGWTREQAVEFMASNTALSLHEVNTEIDRYIGWPGQAVSYKMGELKIKELRSRAEQQLGENFSIQAFHDLVLSQGAMPLETLEWMVEKWME